MELGEQDMLREQLDTALKEGPEGERQLHGGDRTADFGRD